VTGGQIAVHVIVKAHILDLYVNVKYVYWMKSGLILRTLMLVRLMLIR
jgi:hypothetical protein